MFEKISDVSHSGVNIRQNRLSKSKIVLVLAAAIVMLLIGYKWATTKLTYKEYTAFGDSGNELTTISVDTNDELRQTFDMPYDIVTSIAVRIGTFDRDNNSEWRIYLCEAESNQVVAQKRFNASLIADDSYYEIKLPKNVRVSRDHKYTLVIQAERVSEDSQLAFYVDPNSESDGNYLSYAGEIIPGQLVTKVYGGNVDYWWFKFYCCIILVLLFTLVRALRLMSEGKNPLEDKAIQALLIGIAFFLLQYSFSTGETFTDENDNIRGGLVIANGGILYKDYVTQHTPVVYYICSVFARLGAGSISQFRLSYYLLEAVIWALVYCRYSKFFGKRIALIPILEAVCISSVANAHGYQILSDGWQGLMFVILLLEFLQYYKDRALGWQRCIIISICIWGSFGAAFISAFSLVFLALIVLIIEARGWKNKKISFKPLMQRYYKFLAAIGLPFAAAAVYFKANGALWKAYEQCYVFNREVYPQYIAGQMGDKIMQPFVNGVQNFFGIIADSFNSIITATATNVTVLQLILMGTAVAVLIKRFEKKEYAESTAIFLMMIFSATRGYGFHGLAAWYIAVMVVAMNLDLIKKLLPKAGTATITLVCIVLASTYVNQVGTNLLYEPQSVSELETKVIELTSEDEDKDIFMDAFACDSIYLFYKGRKPVNPAVYILPWYMDWYEQDDIAALEEYKPRVLVYYQDRECWGLTHYNNELDKAIQKDYTRRDDQYSIWVRNE